MHLHFIVLLFGFTAILGKLVQLDAVNLVAYRMTLAFAAMTIMALLTKRKGMPPKEIAKAAAIGILVALHWIFFFLAVKVSNVSVTLGTMASGTLFVSLLEPLVDRRRVYGVELFIGLVIIGGLYLITQFAFHYLTGILYALFASFLASLFGVLNRQMIKKGHDSLHISLWEMLSGSVAILLFLSISTSDITWPSALSSGDWVWVLILAWMCTAYAFVATVYLLKYLSTYTVSLAINLEPVYGIILAFIIFGESEKMHPGFYLGTIVILAAIFLYPILMKKFHRI